MSKIFMICPVRGIDEEVAEEITHYVNQLEAKGYNVHFPLRDVDQSFTDGGKGICMEHLMAMLKMEDFGSEVHIWIRGDNTISEGEHFDFGMALMLAWFHKHIKFVIANGPLLKTKHNSFTNLLLELIK